jgi:hypothetical protein
MVKITRADFDKLVSLIKKEGMDGASLNVYAGVTATSLLIKTVDRQNKDILIELSDEEYPFMPRVTRTETF